MLVATKFDVAAKNESLIWLSPCFKNCCYFFLPILIGTILFQVVNTCQIIPRMLKAEKGFTKRQCMLSTSSEDLAQYADVEPDASDQEKDDDLIEDTFSARSSYVYAEGAGGKPGLISFYNYPYKKEATVLKVSTGSNKNKVLWFVGPAVLVASFVFPSLYLRRILSTVFEDSLLTG